jgi:hypothetical protein
MPETPVRRHGGNVRNGRTTHPYRQERRKSAAVRLQEHSERSVEDQLLLIADRPGESRTEVSRLTGGAFNNAHDALRALREG